MEEYITHKRIEDLYEEKFKTQKELAFATGLSKDEISRIMKRQTMNISHGRSVKNKIFHTAICLLGDKVARLRESEGNCCKISKSIWCI